MVAVVTGADLNYSPFFSFNSLVIVRMHAGLQQNGWYPLQHPGRWCHWSDPSKVRCAQIFPPFSPPFFTTPLRNLRTIKYNIVSIVGSSFFHMFWNVCCSASPSSLSFCLGRLDLHYPARIAAGWVVHPCLTQALYCVEFKCIVVFRVANAARPDNDLVFAMSKHTSACMLSRWSTGCWQEGGKLRV